MTKRFAPGTQHPIHFKRGNLASLAEAEKTTPKFGSNLAAWKVDSPPTNRGNVLVTYIGADKAGTTYEVTIDVDGETKAFDALIVG